MRLVRSSRLRTQVILGAWGCSVFKNNPESMARIFATLLDSDPFCYFFQRVVFAIYDKSKDQHTYKVFHDRFAAL